MLIDVKRCGMVSMESRLIVNICTYQSFVVLEGFDDLVSYLGYIVPVKIVVHIRVSPVAHETERYIPASVSPS